MIYKIEKNTIYVKDMSWLVLKKQAGTFVFIDQIVFLWLTSYSTNMYKSKEISRVSTLYLDNESDFSWSKWMTVLTANVFDRTAHTIDVEGTASFYLKSDIV